MEEDSPKNEKTAKELFGFSPYCAACFGEIPSNHFNTINRECCPKCGNDFLGRKWYSSPFPKHVIELIKGAISTSIDNDIDLEEIHECKRCQYSPKLGFCPKCDTDCESF